MTAKTPEQLNYSKPLDVHTWSNYPEVNEFVNKLWDQFLADKFIDSIRKGKRPLTSIKQQFKVLLLDLFVTWKTDPELLIGVAMSKSSYKTNSRYNALHISQKMIELVNALVEMELIEKHTGSELAKRVTRIWPTQKLIDHFNNTNFSLLQINTHQDQEVIILNKGDFESVDEETGEITTVSRQAKPIEYSDEDFEDIPKMREEINKYNELLRTSFIDIGHLEEPIIIQKYWDRIKRRWSERRVQVNHQNKFVRRVFYRSSWTLGGRVHGGFWQQIKEERTNILINDFRTVEQDYSGLHINIAYGLEGLDPLEEDPYTVEPVFNVTTQEQREWVKSLSLMVINAKDELSAIQAFRAAQPTGSLSKTFTNNQIKLLIDAFKEKHHHIRDYICSDQGVSFMNLDGKITSRVINHFTNKREPILSIHDSYICREQFTDELNTVMNEVINELLHGYKINIKANKEVEDLSSITDNGVINVSDLEDFYFNRPEDTKTCEGYEARWEHHKEWLHTMENPLYFRL